MHVRMQLEGRSKEGKTKISHIHLPWMCRISIATDTARGLAYLHTVDKVPLVHNEIFFSESGPYTIRNELFTGFLQTFLHSLIHPRMAKGPIWSVGYNPNQTVYGPDAVCTTERKHVVKPLYGSCSKCTCYVYKMFSNSLYNAVHIITKRCHCPVM